MSWLSHFNIFKNFWEEIKFAFKARYPFMFIIIIPFVYPLLITLTYANQSVVERHVVIMDEDNSDLSRAFILNVDATQGAEVIRHVYTAEEGVQAVISREADAFIHIPEDFSAKFKRIEQADMKAYVYATNMMIYAAVMTAIQETVLSMNHDLALERVTTPKGITRDRAESIVDPIRYDKAMLFSPTLAYSSFICPVLFLLVVQQMMLIVPGLSIGFRRETDPEFKKRHLWLIDYLPHFIFFAIWAMVGVAFIYGFLCPTFGWPMASFKEMFILAMTICLLHFPISAILMSVAQDKFTTFQLVLALSVPCFMISGYVWPQYSMPGWVSSMSDWFIINPVSQGLRKVVFKGQSIQDLGPEYAKMLKIFVYYCIAAVIIVHRGIIYRTVKRIRARKAAKAEAPTPAEGKAGNAGVLPADHSPQKGRPLPQG